MRCTVVSVGSLIALFSVWVLTYALSGATVELVEPPANFVWCCRIVFWLAGVLIPLSAIAEFGLVRRSMCPQWVHVLITTIMLTVASVVLEGLFVLAFLGPFAASFKDLISLIFLGIQNLLWGGASWFLLRATDAVLKIAFGD